jgi:hypothetical protein
LFNNLPIGWVTPSAADATVSGTAEAHTDRHSGSALHRCGPNEKGTNVSNFDQTQLAERWHVSPTSSPP